MFSHKKQRWALIHHQLAKEVCWTLVWWKKPSSLCRKKQQINAKPAAEKCGMCLYLTPFTSISFFSTFTQKHLCEIVAFSERILLSPFSAAMLQTLMLLWQFIRYGRFERGQQSEKRPRGSWQLWRSCRDEKLRQLFQLFWPFWTRDVSSSHKAFEKCVGVMFGSVLAANECPVFWAWGLLTLYKNALTWSVITPQHHVF